MEKLKSMPFRDILKIALIIFVSAAVLFINVRFKNIPYINNLFFLPIILSGFFISTSASTGIAVLSSFYLFSTSGILDSEKIVGLSIQALSFLVAALLSGSFSVIQNMKITNALIQKRQLQSLNKVTSNFIASLEPAAVYDQLVREAKALMAFEAALLVSYTRHGELKILAEDGASDLLKPQFISRFSQSIPSNKDNTEIELMLTGLGETTSFKKAYIIPIINGEYLIVATKKNRKLTKEELEYLHSFLDEAHIALTGAKYYAQKEAQARFINTLAELNKAAASLWETKELIDLTLKRLMEINKAQYGVFIAIKDSQPVIASISSIGAIQVEKLEAIIKKNLVPQILNELANIKDPEIFSMKKSTSTFFKNILDETESNYLIYFPIFIKGTFSATVILLSDELEIDQKEILRSISSEIAILFYNTKLISNIKNLTLKTVESIVNAFDSANPYTRGHSVKVAKYATEIAREMGLSFKDVRSIQFAALLHDMGRIFIDDDLINAPRKLNGEELKVVRKLPEISSKVVKNVDFFESIIPIIYHHKEHFDGSGYPSGLSGEKIPIGSRIIHAAESFVAMTSERPYRKPMTVEQAVKEMVEKSGKQFDPAVVEAFIRVLKREYPSLMFDFSALG